MDRWGSFLPEDGGGSFLGNVRTVCQTTCSNISEEHNLNLNDSPASIQGKGVIYQLVTYRRAAMFIFTQILQRWLITEEPC
jgi:hypothetical protein